MNQDELKELVTDVASVFNKHGLDTKTSTPDFILATFAVLAVNNLKGFVEARDKWFGFDSRESL